MRRRRVRRAAALALLGLLVGLACAPSAPAAFAIADFEVAATESDQSPATLAGSHPHALTTKLAFSDGEVKDLRLQLPGGLIENPLAVPACSQADFHVPRSPPHEASRSGERCPDATQIGTVAIEGSFGERSFGLFNLAPPPGHPSRFGASLYGAPLHFVPEVRQASGEYGIDLIARNVSQLAGVEAIELELWGVPWAGGHDGERGNCLNEAEPGLPHGTCKVEVGKQPHGTRAYLTLPSSCSGPLSFEASAESWGEPGARRSASEQSFAMEGCEGVPFFALAAAQPSSAVTSSPTGMSFQLTASQAGLLSPTGRLASRIEKATISLPAGLTVNPAVASGLDACTEAQFAAESASSVPGAGCPNPSKIGTLTLTTPLLAEELSGSIFLARPFANPFGSQLALYLVAKVPERGILVKVAGELEADPHTGQLIASFEGLPQLPYSNLKAEFREGQRAPLSTPEACGRYTSQVALSPWSDPGFVLTQPSSFEVVRGLGQGGACPSGQAPFSPQATAGALNSNSGSTTPFYIRLTRRDSEQEITSYSAVLPRGMTGSLAGIPFCSDAAIEAAKTRSGRAEEASPSCPAQSRIGRTFVGYGVGLAPAYAPGKMYLAGPYRGSPLSVVAIDSAAVGPFDLGTIVIRSALRVDPLTAQLSIDSAVSDPIPHILGGIPLRLRDVRVHIDRPGFAINPTSCAAASVTSTLTGSGARFSDPSDDTTASATNPFQVSNCSARGLGPRLALRLRGKTRRGGYPSLRAELVARAGDANLSSAQVSLPQSAFLAQNHIRGVCTRERFAAQRCPAESIYGSAVAHTPLLDEPLSGPVYLRSSENPLPDLVFDLRQGAIRIILSGRVDSVGRGRIRASFEHLPDAPLARFVLTMHGGRRGLIVNSANLCAAREPAKARLIAHNNRGALLSPRLRATCPKGKK